ncbi:FAD-binding and (Fe-S)-binding domain-containing protein [Singulisphaera acidiphila]|uniref:FAD/FMN-dependent dehydrogenase n=1 Tax=Singulisphaera acidiphila (strain ATCC BAA-1392 / DSM 18658 / VKM B-2454 / MOB10) TaxID=886293 RepID=L0D917_SINAD|nr:FAD-binding and (Fe-S)-binding domain-containing protein [Singulisphaera acidiphila]AGA25146.1 FAD/FMN-dependent dehydrogenase [Singulisphaera acidiphila DSM 18658]
MTTTTNMQRLQDRLSRETRAEVRFDRGSRGLYSTDASLYQIEPLGVVVPRTAADVVATVRIAADEGVPIVPRGAATSLSGQTIGPAIVLDFSKYLNRVGVVDRDRMTVRVEPGVVLDRLNAHLRPLGLMFGPDVSTSDRATIGGMIGNNSAGARSLRYGKTVDHVLSVDVVLADGTSTTLGPVPATELDALCARPDSVGTIHRVVRDTVARHRAAIEAKFPKILRRVSGYNLDEFVPGLPVRAAGWQDDPWQFNLARLIVGSEGTLAVVQGAELKVVPIPAATGLVVLSFATIPAALDRLEEIVATGPVAVEMLDRMILDLAATHPAYAGRMEFAEGRPAAVLAAQFYADSAEELADRANDLARRFEGRPHVLGVRKSLGGAEKDDFWKVRKAGFSLLMGLVGDSKPVAFVEDTAVAPARLPAFYERFEAIVERQGVEAACYGHADVGCLHIRPILNVKTHEGVESLRTIAREVSDLVVEFEGAMSGEHGDGLARSLWNTKLFGPEVYGAFEAVKRAFDPENRMNPGKVVAAPDPGDNLRISPDYHPHEPESTVFDFSSQGGFARAVEMCSGVGACRKTGTGTMCPSYMVTMEEEHTTRGRANALRMAMTGELGRDGFQNEALHEALDLCLQCKACKSECPSNVDMAKLKAEVLHQVYKEKRVPIGTLLMGHIHRLNPIGSATAPLANWTLQQPSFKWLLEKVAGIDRRRTLPTFARDNLRRWFRRHPVDPRAGTQGSVLLMDDCFTTYNNPEIGRAAVRVLEASGYRVELAGLPCCGRPALSKGLLTLGRDLARENVRRLVGHARKGTPILGCEPSCLLTLVDEYRDFRLGPDADLVAKSSQLVDAFVADPARVPSLPLRPLEEQVLLHGHCQQKALVGTAGTMAALRRIPGLEVKELDSGCCGMAGSFGYEHGHYEVSAALANRVILPAMQANPKARLVAPGFSCRSQVHGLAGHNALHPIELLAEQLTPQEA